MPERDECSLTLGGRFIAGLGLVEHCLAGAHVSSIEEETPAAVLYFIVPESEEILVIAAAFQLRLQPHAGEAFARVLLDVPDHRGSRSVSGFAAGADEFLVPFVVLEIVDIVNF